MMFRLMCSGCCEVACKMRFLSVGFLYMVVCRVLRLSLYMVVSRKLIEFFEYSKVNLMVSCV